VVADHRLLLLARDAVQRIDAANGTADADEAE